MEVKLDIPFEQLLRVIRQLSPAQRKKIKAELDSALASKAAGRSLQELLLDGPVFSKDQLDRMAETRKALDQWRGK